MAVGCEEALKVGLAPSYIREEPACKLGTEANAVTQNIILVTYNALIIYRRLRPRPLGIAAYIKSG